MSAEMLTTYTNSKLNDAYVASCWATAVALVTERVGGAVVPPLVLERATLEVGAELVYRKQAPSGFTQFATPDGANPQRIARDPFVSAWPLLAPYVGLGIA